MTEFLSGVLFAAVVLLVPATVGAFTVGNGNRARPARTSRAVVAAVVVGLLGLGIAALLGRGPIAAAATGAVLAASILVWIPAGRDWATRGLVAWALSLVVGLGYLVYVLLWMAGADLTAGQWVGGGLLWLLEAFVFLIGVGYLWELIDVLARRTWSTYVDASSPSSSVRPFVSLHVPTHNEPPDMVIETLTSLLALEYDDYEVLLVDNNTDDEALWRPVEAFCAKHERLRFLHLPDWPGYKSGALNEALRVTDPRAEVIGIVDADYIVDPDFLAKCAPLFGDPGVSFVQTPQDYRGWQEAPYFRRLYYSYGYFFDVSQKSRNERNGAIFGGTMGLIRRSELQAAGGWDEWCITEDAELSLRLLKAGGRGIHVDQSFGHGIMPLTFEALKRQRYRWCFGGVQILRMHWRSLLPGRRTEANQLTAAQRWAYLVGGLQWFGDLASVLFTAFLLTGAAGLVFGHSLVVRQLSGLILLCLVALVVLGAVRSLALVRRTSGATWGEAFGAFGLWLALGWTVARASSRGLVARHGAFLRTPKVRGELGWRDALRGNVSEVVLALICATAAALSFASAQAVTGILIGTLLLVHAVGYAAAPINSLAAIRSDLPEELRRRRREGLLSWTGPAARRGGIFAGAAAATAAFLLAFAAPVGAPDLSRVPDRVRDVVPTSTPKPDPTRGPSESPTGGTTPGATLGTATAPSSTGAVGPGSSTTTATPATTPTVRPSATAPPGATAQPTAVPTPTTAPTQPATGKPTATPTRKPTTSGQTTTTGGRP